MGFTVDSESVVTASAFDAKTEEVKIINFKVIGIAGCGTSIVYKTKLVGTEKSAAIKSVLQLKSSRSNVSQLGMYLVDFQERELKLLKMTTHPNVVDFRFYFIEESQRHKVSSSNWPRLAYICRTSNFLILALNISRKLYTTTYNLSPWLSRGCQSMKSDCICISASEHSHTSTQWEFVIVP